MTIYETDIADPERDAMMRWQQCGECHEPDRAMDQISGLCHRCWRLRQEDTIR